MKLETLEDIKHEFYPISNSELTEVKRACIEKVQRALADVAHEVLEYVPKSSHRSTALRKILEAKFDCVQAITHVNPEIKEAVQGNKPEGKNNGKEKTQSK